ncbi:hypothetical protein [Bartonella machadoae]|uniref:hypothetical protein n=1 Tax=Bartonella machadoae TaxID=2893471 RepID=UPI001F4CCE54|nr:hypothetical protein [Bartonella machadoae]UNE54007.1 hypothetical protein LNM86_10660 [Bartonella machadoae]
MRGTALFIQSKMVRKAVALLRVDLVCLTFFSEAIFLPIKMPLRRFLPCISFSEPSASALALVFRELKELTSISILLLVLKALGQNKISRNFKTFAKQEKFIYRGFGALSPPLVVA